MKIFLILTVFLIFFIHSSSSSSLFNAFYLRDNRINYSKSKSILYFFIIYFYFLYFFYYIYIVQSKEIFLDTNIIQKSSTKIPQYEQKAISKTQKNNYGPGNKFVRFSSADAFWCQLTFVND